MKNNPSENVTFVHLFKIQRNNDDVLINLDEISRHGHSTRMNVSYDDYDVNKEKQSKTERNR